MFDTAAVGAAIGAVEVTIEKVTAIAQTALPQAESEVTTSSTGFRNLSVSLGSFGDVPLAQELAQQHEAAHRVFVETVEGVLKDLQEFRQKLLDSMKSHSNTDDAAQAALLALGRKYDGHQFHSDENWNRSRQEQAESLETSHGGSAPQPHDSGAGAPTGPGTEAGGAQPEPAVAEQPPTEHGAF
jgi:hypothetical protein